GVRSRIESGCVIEESLLMGADFYQASVERQGISVKDDNTVGIGADTLIRGAIIDKNASIGNNVKIINKDNVQEADREAQGFYIRSGIVVVLKNA
ncbi:MAG: glucose-1-phosphate adenylyltransferase, partial [Nostoc sp.]